MSINRKSYAKGRAGSGASLKAVPRLSRRLVLTGASTIAAATLTSGLAAPAVAQTSRKTFVLVHGAWHGGWCWKYVRDILEAKGHRVYTPTMTGLAEYSHMLSADVDMDTHIQDITNLFWWEDLNDVTLVAHSYAGWVCSGALENVEKQVSSLVMVDAFLPVDGTSAYDTNIPQQQAKLDELRAAGLIARPPIPAEAFRVKTQANIDWVNAKMTPQPMNAVFTKIQLTGARERIGKKLFVRALGFPQPAFAKNYEDTKADPTWNTYGVPEDQSGHDIMVDAPELLSKLVEQAAA
ncbi:alpha/beta fold hydrolase [Chelativorans alearense]|uniref:alpha/beta fold hydrolase n=1 Tax=Chelativorans alearense TaxID=2681495 RepID=UPI0013D2295D|nr:alpha/beta hydrolase family protein [Chelativorans alearense]